MKSLFIKGRCNKFKFMRLIKLTSFLSIGILFNACDSKNNVAGTENASSAAKTEIKTPDQEMSEKLIGVYFQDEDEDAQVSDISYEFFKDGKIISRATKLSDALDSTNVDIKMQLIGIWKIENGFLKMIYEKMKAEPDIIGEEARKEMVRKANNNSTALKIIELTEQKIVTEDADGKVETLKKRVQ